MHALGNCADRWNDAGGNHRRIFFLLDGIGSRWLAHGNTRRCLLAALAYSYGRRHAKDARFTFGTGKVGVLGLFTSAIVLSIIALVIASDSVHRLLTPQVIHFRKAIAIAVVGLFVNLLSAFMLKDEPHHHGHDHSHAHEHHHDLNLRAAFIILTLRFGDCSTRR
ncbi:MAG TPA: cation transporter [Candidatus Angelobacter sp.]|nr:cation transporter [Candidatus Angelobacter sp.]